MSHPRLWNLLFFAVFWLQQIPSQANRQPETGPAPQLFDCGTLSLYTLLHIEGKTTELSQLEAVLPPPLDPRGYSMKDLQDAARSRGLVLDGLLLEKDPSAIDRPMIVFMKQYPHGHFMVLRPVGLSGKHVQVLDPNHVPDIIDKTTLFESDQWTGLALVPRQTDWGRLVGWCLVAGSITSALLLWLRGRTLRQPPSACPAS